MYIVYCHLNRTYIYSVYSYIFWKPKSYTSVFTLCLEGRMGAPWNRQTKLFNVVKFRVEPSTPKHSYNTATAVDFRSLFLKYSTAVKNSCTAIHSTSQLFFRCTQLFPDKSKIKLWNLRKAKIFQTKHYFENRLSKFGDLGFNHLQKYDRINSQKIRIQDSQSKKSLKTLFSATLSRNTALLHSCFLSAVHQLHKFSQHLKFSSQIQHSTQHSTFCTVLCCGVQGSTLVSTIFPNCFV